MTQSVRSHTGPAALIKLAQDVLNTEIAGLAAVRDRLNARTPEKAPLVLARWGFWRRAPGVWS